jgi:hypothetical protein
VFLRPDRRLDRHGAGRIVRRSARRAGIGKWVGPHTLRHTFITAALDAGVPLRARRMSWAADAEMAKRLGARHARYGPAFLYKTTAAPAAILAHPERRDEGCTIVVDPEKISRIELVSELPARR